MTETVAESPTDQLIRKLIAEAPSPAEALARAMRTTGVCRLDGEIRGAVSDALLRWGQEHIRRTRMPVSLWRQVGYPEYARRELRRRTLEELDLAGFALVEQPIETIHPGLEYSDELPPIDAAIPVLSDGDIAKLPEYANIELRLTCRVRKLPEPLV